MCESDPLAEYAQEEEPEVDLMQRAQVKYNHCNLIIADISGALFTLSLIILIPNSNGQARPEPFYFRNQCRKESVPTQNDIEFE